MGNAADQAAIASSEHERNHKVCADCTLCCTVYEIPDLEKKQGHACVHTHRDGGCDIWGLHPSLCQEFKCLWLRHKDMNALWRPDIAGFVLRLDTDGTTLNIDIDPKRPEAWRQEPYYGQLKIWSEVITRGEGLLVVHLSDGICVITPDEDLYLRGAKRGEILETGMEMSLFGPRPFARIVPEISEPNRKRRRA